MESQAFSSLPLSKDLLEVCAELGYEKMTPIQQQSIPVLLEGKDFVGQAQTGSGKTAAFAIPILQKIDLQNRNIQALIICPTRELGTQVAREIRKLARRFPGLQVLIVSGGQPLRDQAHALRKGVHILVGTPGRLLDHGTRGNLDLADMKTLVLDEADRMLDMGFEQEMTAIMSELPETRQTVFFSATYPPSIQEMSKKFQKNPVVVTIAADDSQKPDIEQIVILEADPEQKITTLQKLMRHYKTGSAIIFCNLKVSVASIVELLKQDGINAEGLQGDLEQRERDLVMAKFRNGSIRVLVATDVASRGLDVEDLGMVVNFDLPHEPSDYVHRIGRTGRAGRKGLAITIAEPRDRLTLREYEEAAGAPLRQETLQSLKMDAIETAAPVQAKAEMETLYISGGRKEKVRPGDILGALTGDGAGLPGSDVGKIEIHDHFSYVAVSKAMAGIAAQRLGDGRIKGKRLIVRLMK